MPRCAKLSVPLEGRRGDQNKGRPASPLVVALSRRFADSPTQIARAGRSVITGKPAVCRDAAASRRPVLPVRSDKSYKPIGSHGRRHRPTPAINQVTAIQRRVMPGMCLSEARNTGGRGRRAGEAVVK